ncbi:transmembrane protease serine 9-like [Uranotaenia lowii]|uniref:transmembrane protease serine 9-like n=1 Tax=Uranotaenia lowii TaxID=190385 RepID=UPI002479C32F|nr:transmembrane protease serine 9-like [Uranotaenia lowii]
MHAKAVVCLLILTTAQCCGSTDASNTTDPQCARLLNRVRCGSLNLKSPEILLPGREAEALKGEFPWHAALLHREFRSVKFTYSCGGSLINEWFVLTAAHCLINQNNGNPMATGDILVLLGAHELDKEDNCVQTMRLQQIHIHEEYSLDSHKHDIGLVMFSERVIFTPRVLPVCLDICETEEPNFYQQYGKVAGWGFTEKNALSDWLRMTELPIVDYSRCLTSNPTIFANTIYEGMFCAGFANGMSICNGDSGGGLVTFTRNRWILRGVASFTALRSEASNVCDAKQYAGFIKVQYYRRWLKSLLRLKNEATMKYFPQNIESICGPNNCGERKINKRSLIVNGRRSFAGEWPWQVAIFSVRGGNKTFFCGGNLISDLIVLTAAHCLNGVHRSGVKKLVVVLGENNLIESSVHMQEVLVRTAIYHPKYNRTIKINDIGLLELATPVQFNDYIQPVCLPRKSDLNLSLYGSSGTILGWDDPDDSIVLRSTTTPVVEGHNCVWSEVIEIETVGNICTGPAANDSYIENGDSGGGMLFEKDGKWTVRGIIATTIKDTFTIMTNTAFFLDWIKRETEAADQRTTERKTSDFDFELRYNP